MVAGDGLVRCAVNDEPSERMTVCGYRAGTGAGMDGGGRRCDFVGHGEGAVCFDRCKAVRELGPGVDRTVRRRVGRDILVGR